MPPSEPSIPMEPERDEHQVERSAHAIYGLVIITATLVADLEAATDALTSLLVLWGAGVVLLLAHLYSAAVAQAGGQGRWLSHVERHVLIADNIPVMAALVLPSLCIVLAGAGVMDLTFALEISIVESVAALFAVGAYQAYKQGASLTMQVGIGVLGVITGLVVIVLEVALAH